MIHDLMNTINKMIILGNLNNSSRIQNCIISIKNVTLKGLT